MKESTGFVSIDMEKISLGGKEHIIKSSHGSVSVVVYGDQSKPALITYPDLALNHMSCFQVLFFCPEISSLLLHNFCIYHISPPGHELGAATIDSRLPIPSVDDLADQVLDVLSFFKLGAVMCMGVTAGAYVLTLFAIKYAERVQGLILVSPLCKTPSWTEWFVNKVMNNILYFYGTCGMLKELLLQRYFSKEARLAESNLVVACRSLLDERQSTNVRRFLQSIHGRRDISKGLKELQCRTLIFVGENSPFHSEALHMISELDSTRSALIEVRACGSLVTEEQVSAMLVPLERFLVGFALFRPARPGFGSVSPARVWPELLSPESMKLKPIRTRVSAGTQ